ncbi:hypothetical protein SNEBB_009639 [Seison nebaliae]|nr:hypothetical protein SNEBB_009639 [Seison nebaliae]
MLEKQLLMKAGPLARLIGPRYIQLCKNWLPSTIAYGTMTGLAVCYFTDWRVIVDKIPIYNRKFPVVEEEEDE